MSAELKPCPFCGGEAGIAEDHAGMSIHRKIVPTFYTAVCTRCNAEFDAGRRTAEEAAALWNTRTPAPVAVTDAWSALAAMPVCPIPDDAAVGDFVMLRCGQTRWIAHIPRTVPNIALDDAQDPKWIRRSGEALSSNRPDHECVGFKRAVLTPAPGKDRP